MYSIRPKYVALTVSAVLTLCTLFAVETNSMAFEATQKDSADVSSVKDDSFAMLNALWFKPDSGKQTYLQYMKAAGPFVVKYGGKPGSAYSPEANVIGEFDADLVFFVEWPSTRAFEDFVKDPGYQAISHLREDAIRDSLLIRCKKRK